MAGSITSSPSGLATRLATFARNLVLATPTERISPVSWRTRFRMAAAMAAESPNRWVDPVVSMKASSIEICSMFGVNSAQRSNTASDILPVLLEVARHDDERGAEPAGDAGRHRRADAEPARLVGGGHDHPLPHRHGLAPQGRVEHLFGGRVEGVEVDVQDRRGSPRRARPGHWNRLARRAPTGSVPALGEAAPGSAGSSSPVEETVKCPVTGTRNRLIGAYE